MLARTLNTVLYGDFLSIFYLLSETPVDTTALKEQMLSPGPFFTLYISFSNSAIKFEVKRKIRS